jgi:hypothetical protein
MFGSGIVTVNLVRIALGASPYVRDLHLKAKFSFAAQPELEYSGVSHYEMALCEISATVVPVWGTHVEIIQA